MDEATARAIKRRAARWLMKKPGVVTVGVEARANGLVLVVRLLRDAPRTDELPTEIEGLPLALERSGPISLD